MREANIEPAICNGHLPYPLGQHESGELDVRGGGGGGWCSKKCLGEGNVQMFCTCKFADWNFEFCW